MTAVKARDHELYRIDPATNPITATIALQSTYCGPPLRSGGVGGSTVTFGSFTFLA
jgi:hypothetical protein